MLGFIDFFTAGLFFLFYMPLGGLQRELEEILGHRVRPYWQAYLLGVPTLFIYTLVWMANVAEELKAVAEGLENMLGCCCFGPMIATHRFFRTLNRVEKVLNEAEKAAD